MAVERKIIKYEKENNTMTKYMDCPWCKLPIPLKAIAKALGRAGGLKGGPAKFAKMSPEEQEIERARLREIGKIKKGEGKKKKKPPG